MATERIISESQFVIWQTALNRRDNEIERLSGLVADMERTMRSQARAAAVIIQFSDQRMAKATAHEPKVVHEIPALLARIHDLEQENERLRETVARLQEIVK